VGSSPGRVFCPAENTPCIIRLGMQGDASMTAAHDPTSESVEPARLLALYRHLAHILEDLDRQDRAAAPPVEDPPTPTTANDVNTKTGGA
jgi:hypothetical protein